MVTVPSLPETATGGRAVGRGGASGSTRSTVDAVPSGPENVPARTTLPSASVATAYGEYDIVSRLGRTNAPPGPNDSSGDPSAANRVSVVRGRYEGGALGRMIPGAACGSRGDGVGGS